MSPDLTELLTEAIENDLTIRIDGSRLVVRGHRFQQALAVRLLARKADLMPLLAKGQRLLQNLQRAGHTFTAHGAVRLRVTPPLPEDRRVEAAALKMVLLTLVRASTRPEVQVFYDIEVETGLPPRAAPPSRRGSETQDS